MYRVLVNRIHIYIEVDLYIYSRARLPRLPIRLFIAPASLKEFADAERGGVMAC